MILNPIKYWKLKRLCREHARKYNMQYEFDLACGMFGDPIEALEEWDLLNDEIIMKIQAEYNSLIDIELPPPRREDCTTISIDSIGVTIRIRERAAAPPPKRKVSSFPVFIVNSSQAETVVKRLHGLIDGKPPKTCALTILAAISAGLLTQPTYSALRDEFPEIGARTNYSYYLGRTDNYTKDIEAISKSL